MYDKLSLINSALIRTSNSPVATEGDGSPEWITASDAYDTMLPVVLYEHDWGFSSDTAVLQRVGDSLVPEFTDAYARPEGSLFIEQVWEGDFPTVWKIVNAKVHASPRYGGTLLAQYVTTPLPADFPPMFAEVMRLFVMSACYRGLNEDTGEADSREKAAYAMLGQAKTRSSQEKTPQPLINSGLRRARFLRRTRVC